MARAIMSEFRVTKLDGSEILAVRNNTIGVARDFEDLDDPVVNPIVQIHRTRTNLDVHIPDERRQVHFTVTVDPPAAASAGCLAAPTSFTVPEGKSVVLQALPGDNGYNFVGWFLDAPVYPEDEGFDANEPVSTDPTYLIRITQPHPGQERKIVARFVAA